jgi:hypothetical protein
VGGGWFTYSSTHPEFATVADAVITGVAAGTTVVNASFQGTVAGGGMTVNVTPAPPVFVPPTAPPARPTLDASKVISLFSAAYTNVNIDSFDTSWSNPNNNETDVVLGADTVKKYTGVNFFGIEFFNPEIDASSMVALHFDVYSDCTSVGIKPVNFGAAQTEGEVFTTVTPSAWNSLDILMTAFEANGLGADANLGQIVVECAPQAADAIYLDNIYFHE